MCFLSRWACWQDSWSWILSWWFSLSLNRCFPKVVHSLSLMSQSHQTSRPVPAVKLLGIMFKIRCWSITFHTITIRDAHGWCLKWLVLFVWPFYLLHAILNLGSPILFLILNTNCKSHVYWHKHEVLTWRYMSFNAKTNGVLRISNVAIIVSY